MKAPYREPGKVEAGGRKVLHITPEPDTPSLSEVGASRGCAL